jgi:hypothetical protein
MSATPRQTSEVDHLRQERFRFIESSLLWEGSVQRQRVRNAFHISLNHVTKVLRDYDETHPGSLVYDQRRQSYVPGRRFKPHYASRDPSEYLSLQLVYAESGSAAVAPLLGGGEGLSVEVVPTPALGIEESVLRHVLHAIIERKGVDVLYHSTRATQPGRRKLWPHALVHTGVRWHIRAYDGEREEFRNFALQRIEDPKPVAQARPVPPENDASWVQRSTLKVVPNPKLNPHQQRLAARDFGMVQTREGPAWIVELRNCLIGYFATKYGLDQPATASPAKRRIVLANDAAVRKWFLPGEGE